MNDLITINLIKMKNVRIIIAITIVFLTLTSCADSKKLEINGKIVTVEPYGWANQNVKKVEGVKYQVNFGNVVLSVVGIETVIVPVWLTGWELFEPVALDTKITQK